MHAQILIHLVGDLSLIYFQSNLATVLCIPAVPQILLDLHTDNRLYGTLLVSFWEFGEAVGPLFTAPLSEIYGRRPIYNMTNGIFIIFSIACAVSENISELVVFRLLNGIGDASLALNASIVGDMFVQEERGLAIAVMGFPPLLGPVAGPVIGGFLTEREGWRSAFWFSAISGGVCAIGFLLLFRETYHPRILRQKAAKLRKETSNPAYRCTHDFSRDSNLDVMRQALVRPTTMLIRSPTVLLLTIYISVVFGYLYLLLTTITEVFENIYGFSQGAAGAAYLGLSMGMAIGVVLCELSLD